MEKFEGVGVALFTPFTADKKVDFPSFERLLKRITPHVDYFVVNGTTAESPTLTQEEKQDILDFVVAHNTKNKPIVFGLGGYNTKGIIDIYNQMNLERVDAILSVSPHYVRPTQEGIIEHFTTLADAFPKPIVLYNVPARTGSNMASDTTLTLAQHHNIIGIKEASGDILQCMEIASKMPKEFLLISGDDPTTIPLISIGGAGVISVIANAGLEPFYASVHAALRGNFIAAREVYLPLLKLNQLLFKEGNPAGIKAVCYLADICDNQLRLPLVSASELLIKQLKEELISLKTSVR